MITVMLYSRQNCHLCEVAKQELDSLQDELPHKLVVVDVDQDTQLRQTFGELVPVVTVGPYQLQAPFERKELMVTLGAAQLGAKQDLEIAQSYSQAGGKWTKADRFSYWIAKHYMAFLNTLVLLYFSLPLLAPVLMQTGVLGPARAIYRLYGTTCHQLAFRSWFLFGDQNVYPRAAADIPTLTTYEQLTGNHPEDLESARAYVGDKVSGYKIALCQRDMAIYGSILLFGLIFVATGRAIRGLPWYIWILLALVPIGLDGVGQLVSQPPFNLLPYRESTPFLRTFTGFLFGFTTAWFAYPMVEETMADTRRIMEAKRKWLRWGSEQG
ncbi:MAG: DUF2085 domain-containing protein [Anaerolineales bacterium]